jgi:hypothetical protein
MNWKANRKSQMISVGEMGTQQKNKNKIKRHGIELKEIDPYL